MHDPRVDQRATGIHAELHVGLRHPPGGPGGALLAGLLSMLIEQCW